MVAPFYGHRTLPPVPGPRRGEGWRFVIGVTLLCLACYWLWRDANEHYAHYRYPATPAVCDLAAGKPCRFQTTSGPIDVWQAGMGGIYGSTVGTPVVTTPKPKRDN